MAGSAQGQSNDTASPGTGTLIASGVGAWAGSWLVGGLAGAGLGSWNPIGSDNLDDGFWQPGLVLGLESTQAIAIPLVVHRVNGSRGNLRAATLASTAIGILATAVLWTGDTDTVLDGAPVLFMAPVAQIATSIAIERRTSR